MKWRFLIFLFVVFFFASGKVSAQDQKTGEVSGMLLTKDGTPMSGGLVYFFSKGGPLPDPDRYWRVPDFLAEIKDKGKFSIVLPDGEYYFGAIKRVAGKTENGPPQDGDFFYKALDKKGKPKLYTVKKGKKLNLGPISGAEPFKGLVVLDKISAIEGKVIASDGRPVAGALVFAFLSDSMIGKPLFASYRSDPDGKYLLRVNEGGNYYLKARDIYGGGPPVTGAIIGSFGGEAPKAVMVKTGEITRGIDITVEKFKGRGQQGQQQGQQQ